MKENSKKVLIYFLLIVIFLGGLRFFVMSEELKSAKRLNEGNKKLIDRVTSELESSQVQIRELNEKIAYLENANAELLKEKEALENKTGLRKGQTQKQFIDIKESTIDEFKKLICQIKIKIHEQRIQEALAKRQLLEEMDAKKLELGNRGFIVKEGMPNNKSLSNIEVVVLSTKSGSSVEEQKNVEPLK